jgi:hypothetical protein
MWSVLRFALLWNFTHLRMVVAWRSFGTTFRSHLHGWSSPRRMLDPWIWNRQVVSKRRYKTKILCCVKFQKSANHIYTMAEAGYHACAVLFTCILFYPLKFSVSWNVILCSLATVYQNGEPHVSNVHKLLCKFCGTRTSDEYASLCIWFFLPLLATWVWKNNIYVLWVAYRSAKCVCLLFFQHVKICEELRCFSDGFRVRFPRLIRNLK